MLELGTKELTLSLSEPEIIGGAGDMLRFSLVVSEGGATVLEIPGFLIQNGWFKIPRGKTSRNAWIDNIKLHPNFESFLKAASQSWKSRFPRVQFP